MSNRDECYRDTKTWPVENGRPVPASAVWSLMLKAMRVKMLTDGCEANDITNVTWALREIEMDRVQRRRDAYVARYRPIQTLDGLDPSPSRVGMRRAVKALEAFTMALQTRV